MQRGYQKQFLRILDPILPYLIHLVEFAETLRSANRLSQFKHIEAGSVHSARVLPQASYRESSLPSCAVFLSARQEYVPVGPLSMLVGAEQ